MDSGFDFLKTFCIIKTSPFLTFGIEDGMFLYAWNFFFFHFYLYEYELVEC